MKLLILFFLMFGVANAVPITQDDSFFNDPTALQDNTLKIEDEKTPVSTPPSKNPKNDIIVEKNVDKTATQDNDFAELLPEVEEKEDRGLIDEVKRNVIKKQGEIGITEEGEIVEKKPKSVIDILKDRMFKTDPNKKEEVKKPDALSTEIPEIPTKPTIVETTTTGQKKSVTFGDRFSNLRRTLSDAIGTIVDKGKELIGIAAEKQEEVKTEEVKEVKKITEKPKSKKQLLLEAEIDNAIRNFLEENKKDYFFVEDSKFKDSKEYDDFLNATKKRDETKEKILIPRISPKKKDFISYEVNKHPRELIEPRSENNKHIPKLMMDSDRESTLTKIIEYGMLPEFIAMTRYVGNTNYMFKSNYTLLTLSTKHKQYKIIKYLINNGADINKIDGRYETPLMIAVKNNDIDGAKIFIDAGADLNKTDVFKNNALFYAVQNNFEKIALALIDGGADINILAGNGEGILPIAVRLERDIVVKRIMEEIEKQDKEKANATN